MCVQAAITRREKKKIKVVSPPFFFGLVSKWNCNFLNFWGFLFHWAALLTVAHNELWSQQPNGKPLPCSNGQSELAAMTAPVGRFVHRMGWMIRPISHSPLYLTLINILPQSIFLGYRPLTLFFLGSLSIFSQPWPPYYPSTYIYYTDLNLSPAD